MISDEELYRYEREVEQMAGLTGRATTPDDTPPANPQRIDRIVEKALYEAVVKDTASFVFNSFGHAIFSLTGAVMGHAGTLPPHGRQATPLPPARGTDEPPPAPRG